MAQYLLVVMAFVGGILLAVQGGLNARLGVLLKNPVLASVVAFSCSAFFAVIFILVSVERAPNWSDVKGIPTYLWFTGGLCSVVGVSLYYYTIPKLGMATMISLGLCGQLVFSVVASHFGWLNLPHDPITPTKLLGVAAMIFGIVLINLK